MSTKQKIDPRLTTPGNWCVCPASPPLMGRQFVKFPILLSSHRSPRSISQEETATESMEQWHHRQEEVLLHHSRLQRGRGGGGGRG